MKFNISMLTSLMGKLMMGAKPKDIIKEIFTPDVKKEFARAIDDSLQHYPVEGDVIKYIHVFITKKLHDEKGPVLMADGVQARQLILQIVQLKKDGQLGAVVAQYSIDQIIDLITGNDPNNVATNSLNAINTPPNQLN